MSKRFITPSPCNLLAAIAVMALTAVTAAPLFGQQDWNIKNYPSDLKGVVNNPCYAIIQDSRGIIYFGNAKDIREFDGSWWVTLPGVPDRPATCFTKDNEGRIYAGMDGDFGFLAPDSTGRMQFFSLLDKLPEAERATVGRMFKTVVSQDGIFFLSDHYIYQCVGDSISSIHSQNHYFAALHAFDRYFILERNRGLLEWLDGDFQPVPFGEFIRSLVIKPWSKDQLLIVEPFSQPQIFTTISARGAASSELRSEVLRNAFPQSSNFFVNSRINDVLQLPSRRFVFSTEQNGVAIVDSNGVLQYVIDKKNGLLSNNVFAMYLDYNNGLWIGTDLGISYVQVEPDTALSPLQARGGVPLPSDSTKIPPFTVIIRRVEGVKDDSLLFSGAFSRIPLGAAVLEQTKLFKYEFHYKYNALRFFFSTNQYQNPDSVKYQVQMSGIDKEWSNWSNRNWKEYTNLFEGKYNFRVRAKDDRGCLSGEAVFNFRIFPPWFETDWFYGAQISLWIGLLVVSGILNRMGKAKGTSSYLTNIVVIVIFKYVQIPIGTLIGLYSAGVVFLKIVMSIVVGIAINPAQAFVKKMMMKLTEVGKKK